MLFSAATVALLTAVAAQAGPSLKLDISGTPNVRDVDNFHVTATVTNTGTEEVTLFADPCSALSAFPEDTFTVSSANGRVNFAGAKVKYSFRTAKNLITLAPGANVSVTHDLSASYNFTTTGDYEIDASNVFHYRDASGNAVPIVADVENALTAKLTGSTISSKIAKRNMSLSKRAKFASCSSTQQSQTNTALTTTMSYLSNAVSYLSAQSGSTTRYSTWFGAYTASRKATVLSHFSKVQSSDPRTYTYDCSCTESDVYAYVYPNNFGYIYLCPVYFSAPTSGTDSKAGTIVHEATHFTANGGTQDYAYGQTNAKALAKSNPSNAVMNADSHEYFAENNPALS
ncbi:related to peptidyl-Lys metalloendopeptidase Precursor-Chlorophyllum molybdites [Serendipita indica DSM 11827]|uniref:Related to peptidyl-Lys metalloendopeptidase-Chlorophyllum molybdites n=1 Tax=Serendipita indica (strain DSM 11827) TaxID=1109443 RepID=G4TJ10_SERID|nr:related to peptidyl-Lys metalloendopeptidase Precursor-Chlorophyllum molybdites [Serendipita indica DSM 11827]